MKGILGKKIGMTQVFTKEGKLIPVTVIEVEPNVVTQIKTVEKDGYEAVQLATDTIRESLSNKPAMGHTNKANTTAKLPYAGAESSVAIVVIALAASAIYAYKKVSDYNI